MTARIITIVGRYRVSPALLGNPPIERRDDFHSAVTSPVPPCHSRRYISHQAPKLRLDLGPVIVVLVTASSNIAHLVGDGRSMYTSPGRKAWEGWEGSESNTTVVHGHGGVPLPTNKVPTEVFIHSVLEAMR